MASPKELVQVVARETGVSEATVTVHDRNLALAGLRSVGGRGRAAARMTYTDAASLIIAVAGSRSVKDSARTVREYAPLIATMPLVFVEDGRDVVRGETFGDALAAFLEAVPANRGSYADPQQGSVEVHLYGPKPEASIEWRINGEVSTIKYAQPKRKRGDPAPSFADLQFIAKFTQITLGFVGEIVMKNDSADPKI